MLNDKQQAELDRLCVEYERKIRRTGMIPEYLIRDWISIYRIDMYSKMLTQDKPECVQHHIPTQ